LFAYGWRFGAGKKALPVVLLGKLSTHAWGGRFNLFLRHWLFAQGKIFSEILALFIITGFELVFVTEESAAHRWWSFKSGLAVAIRAWHRKDNPNGLRRKLQSGSYYASDREQWQ